MNQEISREKEMLQCHICDNEKNHILVLGNDVHVETFEGRPVYRDLGLYACEDCGNVRIKV